MSGAAIRVAKLCVFRQNHNAERRMVLADFDADFAAGERVILAGPNGAGKTSLLLALVGALPFDGEIAVDGLSVGPSTLTRIRRRVGFVFADPSEQFFLPNVYDEVAF